jgi:hypothetical protein
MSNKPLILTDNKFDNVVLHPSFALGQSGTDVTGREAFRVADNLRDLTSFMPVETNTAINIYVDCLAPQAVNTNMVILDRGHNLAGQVVKLYGYTDVTFATGALVFSATIPASPGGLPSDANGCLTRDGVWCKDFSGNSSGYRVQLFQASALGVGVSPIITGLYVGTAYRFTEYLDAPGAYDYGTQVKYQRNELSRGAVRVKSRPMNFDKVAFAVALDSADYAGFDAEIRRMLRYNAPCWFAFDDSDTTGVGQMRMFQLPSDLLYDPRVNPVHREIRGEFEEVVPTLYV